MKYTPPSDGITQLTGDGTAGPGTGSQALTLATVTTAETVGDATHYPVVTTDAKGRVTGMVATAVPAGVTPATTVTGPDAYGAAAVVGASTEYARADHDHGLPAAPASNTPATTVTGPDAYGATAVVGVSTEYARADHDHGLPAAPADIPLSTVTTAGDLIVGSGAGAVARLGVGAAGTVLVGGTTPAWSNSPTLNSVNVALAGDGAGLNFTAFSPNVNLFQNNLNTATVGPGLMVYQPPTAGYIPFSVSVDGIHPTIGFVYQSTTQLTLFTKPTPSAAPATALVLGTAWQNTNAWDVTLEVMVGITANTSLVLSLGVGTTATPTQVNIISGSTLTGIVPVVIKVPAGYYALLSSSGTATLSILGQIEFSG